MLREPMNPVERVAKIKLLTENTELEDKYTVVFSYISLLDERIKDENNKQTIKEYGFEKTLLALTEQIEDEFCENNLLGDENFKNNVDKLDRNLHYLIDQCIDREKQNGYKENQLHLDDKLNNSSNWKRVEGLEGTREYNENIIYNADKIKTFIDRLEKSMNFDLKPKEEKQIEIIKDILEPQSVEKGRFQ